VSPYLGKHWWVLCFKAEIIDSRRVRHGYGTSYGARAAVLSVFPSLPMWRLADWNEASFHFIRQYLQTNRDNTRDCAEPDRSPSCVKIAHQEHVENSNDRACSKIVRLYAPWTSLSRLSSDSQWPNDELPTLYYLSNPSHLAFRKKA
jgi:hypothetical protein